MDQINSHGLLIDFSLYIYMQSFISCCFYLTLRGFIWLYRTSSRNNSPGLEWSMYACDNRAQFVFSCVWWAVTLVKGGIC